MTKDEAAPVQEPALVIYQGEIARSNLPKGFTGMLYTTPPAAQRQCDWPTCQSEEYQQSLAEQIKQELVTGSAQRQWVGLTDEEIDKLFGDGPYVPAMLLRDVARAIESKLKEKNA
jgi:hypothetical protein